MLVCIALLPNYFRTGVDMGLNTIQFAVLLSRGAPLFSREATVQMSVSTQLLRVSLEDRFPAPVGILLAFPGTM